MYSVIAQYAMNLIIILFKPSLSESHYRESDGEILQIRYKGVQITGNTAYIWMHQG